VAGQTVGNWRATDDQTYDVNVRLAPEARTSPGPGAPAVCPGGADGGAHRAPEPGGQLVDSTGPSQINRRDLTREVHQRQRGAALGRRGLGRHPPPLDSAALPPGYRYQFSGSTKNMAESFGYAMSALALAIIFIYMILASQFKSFLQPLALMTSLPLTLIGVVLALLMFGSAMSMFSIIGVVMLMGLVTKNAILLVDFAIRAREPHTDEDGQTEPGLPREQALLLAPACACAPS
jgi:HAE1 family hydrophobic/amphiphilic exporter-1